jgi:hypothetical protein
MMKALEVFNRLMGRDLWTAFPQEFFQNRPLETVQKDHCFYCGRKLENYEMHPPGRTPRYMHDHCYRKIAPLSGPKQFCLTCGEPLSLEQIHAQMGNPRELSHVFHPGLCEDYHALLAGIVLGVVPAQAPMLPRYTTNRMIPFDRYSHPYHTDSAIDVEPLKPQRRLKVMKLLE